MPPGNPAENSTDAVRPSPGVGSSTSEGSHIHGSNAAHHSGFIDSVGSYIADGGRLGLAFTESVINSAALRPAQAVSQLLDAGVNAVSGYDLPTLKFQFNPDVKDLGTAGDLAVGAGNAVGFIAPFMLTSELTGRVGGRIAGARMAGATEAVGFANRAAAESIVDLGKTTISAAPASLLSSAAAAEKFSMSPYKLALDGAVSGFVFTPTDKDQNLLTGRLEAAGVNAATFGAMAGVSRGLSAGAESFLGANAGTAARVVTRLGVNGVAGSFGGLVNAESASLLSGKGFASAQDLTRAAGQFAITGLAFDGAWLATGHGFSRGQSIGAQERSDNLTRAVSESQPYAANPDVRSAVNKAVVFALADKSMPFEPTRNLLDKGLGSNFDTVRTTDPKAVDPTMVSALHSRADHELSQRSDAIYDNSETAHALIQANREPGNTVNLERDLNNPINPTLLPEVKAAALLRLSGQTQPLLSNLLDRAGTTFDGVSSSNSKTFEGILGKAVRPSTVEKAQARGFDFQVEHIRDSVRGKITVNDLSDLPDLADQLHKDAKARGIDFVKEDLNMLLHPKLSGWRGAHLDVRFPNGQLGEISLRLKDVEQVPDSHKNYKVIRGADRSSQEFKDRLAESRGKFAQTWQAYLDRTGQTESDVQRYIDQMRATLIS